MAQDIHSQIVLDSELHVPKGFTDALKDTIASKNNVGVLEWIDKNSIAGEQGEIGPSGSIQTVSVLDITNPIELNLISINDFGELILAVQSVVDSADKTTTYTYDTDASLEALETPYVMATSLGANTRWLATGGEYKLTTPVSTRDNKRYVELNEGDVLGLSASTGFNGSTPILSINGGDPSTFDLSAGIMYHVDSSLSPSTVTKVIVSEQLGVTPSFLATETASFISIDINGDIIQRVKTLTATQRRDEGIIGFVSHIDNLVIDTIGDTPQTIRDVAAQTHDIIEALGFFSTSGNQVSGIPATLTMQKATGSGFALYVNAETNPKDPHNINLPVLSPMVMVQILRDASVIALSATIDPTAWDNAGVLDTVPANNNATISYIYLFPNNLVGYLLGQEIFSTLADAKDAAGTETVTIPSDFSNALLLARVIVKKTTSDIANTSDAFILPSTAVSGGGSALTSMQQSYDISVEPEIETDSTRLAVTYKQGSGSDTDNVLEINNGANATMVEFKGNGEFSTQGQAYSSLNTLADAVNISTNCDLGNVHTVTLAGDRTLDNPTNLKAGATYLWIIKQDATGTRLLSYGSAFKFPNDLAPILSEDANLTDVMSGVSDGTNIYVNTALGFF